MQRSDITPIETNGFKTIRPFDNLGNITSTSQAENSKGI